MFERAQARFTSANSQGNTTMLYAHKCSDTEDDLLTNLASFDAAALPFPSKSVAKDEDDEEFRGYDVANTRIEMLLRGWGHPLD